MFLFNVRVYGILKNQQDEILLSDERVGNVRFTKFPGGGLEYGEGLIDALKREYMEECNFEIEVVRHLYTTDFFEKSSFNESQIISIYYEVKAAHQAGINNDHPIFANSESDQSNMEKEQHFRLIPQSIITEEMLTFKTDKFALKKYLENNEK